MKHPLGATRTIVKPRYALFSPDGFVPSVLPGWTGCVSHVLISPALGARFAQLLVVMENGGAGLGSTGDTQMFAYVVEGKCTANGRELVPGGFIYLPPRASYEFRATASGTQLLVFQKPFEKVGGAAVPELFYGSELDVVEQPFLGDPRARLKVLIPDAVAHDMAVNIFTYDPGATLPFVETHVMEHGLLMLSGTGVYRLDADWHPVQAGDVIWMAPYCPQWFVAMGSEPARYIYYKDVNRSPYGSNEQQPLERG